MPVNGKKKGSKSRRREKDSERNEKRLRIGQAVRGFVKKKQTSPACSRVIKKKIKTQRPKEKKNSVRGPKKKRHGEDERTMPARTRQVAVPHRRGKKRKRGGKKKRKKEKKKGETFNT